MSIFETRYNDDPDAWNPEKLGKKLKTLLHEAETVKSTPLPPQRTIIIGDFAPSGAFIQIGVAYENMTEPERRPFVTQAQSDAVFEATGVRLPVKLLGPE